MSALSAPHSYWMICDGETGVLNCAGQGTTVRPCLLVQAIAETTVVRWKAWRSELDGALSLKRDCLPNISVHFWAFGHHGIRFPRFVIRQLLRTDIRGVSSILSCLLQFSTLFASRANFTL